MNWYDITVIYGTKKKLRTFETTLKAKDTVQATQKALNDLFILKGAQSEHIKQALITEV